MTEGVMALARRGAEQGGWCPLCECTVGNGCVSHCDDCILWKEGACSNECCAGH